MKQNIPTHLIGEAWSSVKPFENSNAYGFARLEPKGEFVTRSYASFTLMYTAGLYGIDDTGAIRISFRIVGDWGKFQTNDPKAPNYISATTDAGVKLVLDVGRSPRPRNKCVTINVVGGFLGEGQKVKIIFGDTSHGSLGFKLQTFAEKAFEFKVSVDPCATGHFFPLDPPLQISIVPDKPSVWKAVLPSLRRPGQKFHLGIKAEDIWGNPTPKAHGYFQLKANLPVKGLPEKFEYLLGKKSMLINHLETSCEGILRIKIIDKSGGLIAHSNPMVIKPVKKVGFWGDLHGQSGESIGIGTSQDYFKFARDYAFLDVTSHQANDFQINKAFWEYLNELTQTFQQDGRFVTFPGYEWSGNTGVGGDRNIYFKTEGRPIRRSSHALLTDRSQVDSDACDARKLFSDLADEDCVAYAHIGGRPANIAFAHDPAIETAMEIHSAWGTFEWLMADCFSLGHRVGVVCNSDDHKGRPGASHPGASTFGAYGGLTCFLAEKLTRDSIFDALIQRHHYGTTGTRIHLEVNCHFPSKGFVFNRDPKAFKNARSKETRSVIMGDIAHTPDKEIRLGFSAVTQSGIERIEVRNGTEVLESIRPYQAKDLGSRIRVLWSGAEYRGRGRETTWLGKAVFKNAAIKKMQVINSWNPERKFALENKETITWESITTGNLSGFDVWLNEEENSQLKIQTNHANLSVILHDLGLEEIKIEAGGLDRSIKVLRLPDLPLPLQFDTQIIVRLIPGKDNPLWICLTMEDGSQAWSSPIYLINTP